ncbi:hypothetical protein [Acaryochloris sp. CCMEE 5410]|uniref:hypothetical protein n=1 Tax=Acaryochloris sp. CCMEE 5410 TaxID=310037 RepID=UPI00024842A7|nr:hypothetical protein [Acaryochloris sp. CCMEE 5410]KAI9135135.1 hypothetical protein ON05_019095 [Acaryochloris sp. CCMEE 5410]
MNAKEEQDILIKIFEIDQSRISNIDSTKFIIKGWSVTIATAICGFVLQDKDERVIFLVIGIVTTVFLSILDCIYRYTQLLHVNRAIGIENYLQQYLPLELEKQQTNKPENSATQRQSNLYRGILLANYAGLGRKSIRNYKTIILFHGAIIILLLGGLIAICNR